MKDNMNLGTYDKEKGARKFRIFEKLILVVEVVMVVGALLFGTVFVGLGVAIYNTSVDMPENEVVDQYEENLVNTTENFDNDGNVSTLEICFKVIALISMFFKFDYLRKIFKETADKQTPFTEKNVKNINKVALLSVTCYIFLIDNIFNLYYLVFLAVICSITHIFRYGYELQKESDELI